MKILEPKSVTKWDVGSDAGAILAGLTPGQAKKFREILTPAQNELLDRWKKYPQERVEIADPGHTFIGFTSHVSAGATAHIARRPFIPFKPRRLVVAPRYSEWFSIVDWRVGKNSQTPSADDAPAACFPPIPANASAGDLEAWFKTSTLWGDTVGPGFDLAITVKNNDQACSHAFEALFFGIIDPKSWNTDW